MGLKANTIIFLFPKIFRDKIHCNSCHSICMDACLWAQRKAKGKSHLQICCKCSQPSGQQHDTSFSYLYSSFCEIRLHGDFFSRVNVRIMSFLKGSLQFLQLGRSECGPDATLLAFLCQHTIMSRCIHFVRQTFAYNVNILYIYTNHIQL